MLTMKVLAKEPRSETVNGDTRDGFLMRAGLAPESGNRAGVFKLAVACFVDEADPIAQLNVGDPFPIEM